MMFFKKTTMILSAALAAVSLTACGGTPSSQSISIKVGNAPDKSETAAYEQWTGRLDALKAAEPNLDVTLDSFKYDTKTFAVKASAKQLPNIFQTWFTEIKTLEKSGYIADITEAMDKHGFTQALNPELLELVTDENGRIFGVPVGSVYAQGLFINKKLFRDAGLTDEEGYPMIPKTYEELAETAKIIKEKTGQPGFIFPTTNNVGGWHFMNIAWAYGVEFMEQEESGKWKAIFDTQECRNALQYIKDLKWKYDVLSDNSVIDLAEAKKLFATGQGAMMFNTPPSSDLATSYGMNPNDVFVASMPAGKNGAFSQMGGNIYVFSAQSTNEQIDAGFQWLEIMGNSPKVTAETLEGYEKNLQTTVENKGIVLDRNAFETWVNDEKVEALRQLHEKYMNIDPRNFENYYGFAGVTIKPEEPVCCQELYSVLDKCIQEVVTNENANIDELVTKAAEDFQSNYLDKLDA